MEKNEFTALLTDALASRFAHIEPDESPYTFQVFDGSTIWRVGVTESRASVTKATAIQAGHVVSYMRQNPQADSKEVASACDVTIAYVDILKSALEVAEPAEAEEAPRPRRRT